jgi:hypothetical protein
MLDPVLHLQNADQRSTVAPPTTAASGSSSCRSSHSVAHSWDFSHIAAIQPPLCSTVRSVLRLALRPPARVGHPHRRCLGSLEEHGSPSLSVAHPLPSSRRAQAGLLAGGCGGSAGGGGRRRGGGWERSRPATGRRGSGAVRRQGGGREAEQAGDGEEEGRRRRGGSGGGRGGAGAEGTCRSGESALGFRRGAARRGGKSASRFRRGEARETCGRGGADGGERAAATTVADGMRRQASCREDEGGGARQRGGAPRAAASFSLLAGINRRPDAHGVAGMLLETSPFCSVGSFSFPSSHRMQMQKVAGDGLNRPLAPGSSTVSTQLPTHQACMQASSSPPHAVRGC